MAQQRQPTVTQPIIAFEQLHSGANAPDKESSTNNDMNCSSDIRVNQEIGI